MKTVIALDIGATSIKAAAISADGKILRRATAPTGGAKGPATVLGNAQKLAEELLAAYPKASALGVSSCGSINPETGEVVEATSVMPGWTGTKLRRELARRCGLETAVRNDGEAAALGEAVFGAGKDARVFLMLTLGTGVGGGIVSDGQIFGGENFLAGKIGHMKAVRGGRLCGCGARGCLESYASAYACRKALGMEPKEAFELALKGNKKAAVFVEEAGHALGMVLADVANCINPGVIAIGGGMAGGFKQLRPALMEAFNENAMPSIARSVKIVQARCGNNAGVLGAAALVLKIGQ